MKALRFLGHFLRGFLVGGMHVFLVANLFTLISLIVLTSYDLRPSYWLVAVYVLALFLAGRWGSSNWLRPCPAGFQVGYGLLWTGLCLLISGGLKPTGSREQWIFNQTVSSVIPFTVGVLAGLLRPPAPRAAGLEAGSQPE